MKNIIVLVAVLLFGGFTGSVFAQERKEVKKEIKSIKKEVKIEENNGETTLTIVTDENGKKTKEVYKGKEADAKIQELNRSTNASSANAGTQTVVVRAVTNDKEVTVKTNSETKNQQIETKVEGTKKMKVKKREKAEPKRILQQEL